ncbi:hypothetical protein C8R46DRAFT_1066665 [Mycena filopes]|nr:hypothetical protein C8R46DRAFT_1066665 [Mycena filopes]
MLLHSPYRHSVVPSLLLHIPLPYLAVCSPPHHHCVPYYPHISVLSRPFAGQTLSAHYVSSHPHPSFVVPHY